MFHFLNVCRASGYLVKPASSIDVIAAVNKSLNGLPALCPETEKAMIEWLQGMGKNISFQGLTAREREIMLHVCCNRSNKEIGELLNISEGTVHTHIASLFES